MVQSNCLVYIETLREAAESCGLPPASESTNEQKIVADIFGRVFAQEKKFMYENGKKYLNSEGRYQLAMEFLEYSFEDMGPYYRYSILEKM